MLNPPFFFWKNLEKPPILQRLKPMGFFHIFPWHQRGLTTEKNPIRGSPRGSFNRRCKPWVSLMATTRKDSGASVTLTRPRQIAWQLPVATSQVEMLEKKHVETIHTLPNIHFVAGCIVLFSSNLPK